MKLTALGIIAFVAMTAAVAAVASPGERSHQHTSRGHHWNGDDGRQRRPADDHRRGRHHLDTRSDRESYEHRNPRRGSRDDR
ncbi:MAG: hypothetical protein KJ622_10420 [Alphaproteobacteria bacterium]|nr:hypothetical protein [Alphaproteobacteria bacterium]